MLKSKWRLKSVVFSVLFGLAIQSESASAFSLGLRPYAGYEMMTIPGTTLENPTTKEKLTEDKSVQRSFLFFGGELAVTPVQFGAVSITALLGFRTMKSESPQSLVSDSISLSYLPIGAAVDFTVSRLRFSGYMNYDLGLSPKFMLSVKEPANSLDLKIAKLSRLRFGGFGEFFVNKSLSLFGMGDYATGSYETQSGPLVLTSEGAELPVQVVGSKTKISGLTFGGGVAYYIPPPKSAADVKVPVKSDGKSNQKRPGGKPPVKRVKPKASPGAGAGAQKL